MLSWIILSDSTNSCVFKITDLGSRQMISARMKNKKYIFNIETNIITASQCPPTSLRGLSARVHADHEARWRGCKVCGAVGMRAGVRRCIMGLWCEMRTRRGASAWTHGPGKLGTFVSSTATVPCTENTFGETLLALLVYLLKLVKKSFRTPLKLY